MMLKKVLITGAGGMLGRDVFKAFSESEDDVLATDIDLNESWLHYLDVRDQEACAEVFADFEPDLVVHLAALTDLEFCERNKAACFDTNFNAIKHISELCVQHNAVLCHISTVGVFDGRKGAYDENDIPNPINEYGRSKFQSEQHITQNLERYFIFRAGWMMGGGIDKDKKLVNKIYQQLRSGKRKLHVVGDKYGTPTYTKNLAQSILQMTGTDRYGLYHSACIGMCSRADIARRFVDLLGLKERVEIVEVNSSYFDQEYFTQRPDSERLLSNKLTELGINTIDKWEEALNDYAKEFVRDFKTASQMK